MAEHPAWHLPLGYKDGEYGAELVPSGAYLGYRDMFVFVVDGNRDLDDPTDRTNAGLFRGFILRNSDVRAAALTLDVMYRAGCRINIGRREQSSSLPLGRGVVGAYAGFRKQLSCRLTSKNADEAAERFLCVLVDRRVVAFASMLMRRIPAARSICRHDKPSGNLC